jgi:multicomponent K+:H+ antiporter subunit E
MTRLLPYPRLSAGLLLLWLLLNQALSPGQLLLGTLIAIAGGWALAKLELQPSRLRRPRAILGLMGVVLRDILRSNVAVARIILGSREASSGFMSIPLALRNPYGLAALACIITSTPGTLWVNFDAATGVLTIHVLDLVDEAEWVAVIKERYERPLLEICT